MQTNKIEKEFSDWKLFKEAIEFLYLFNSDSVVIFAFLIDKLSKEITFVCEDKDEALKYKTTDKACIYRFFKLDHSLRKPSKYVVQLPLGS